jgi:DNA-binding XRE family transcriptional regulator
MHNSPNFTNLFMTPIKYRKAREARGTQESVAKLLGVHRVTIAQREIGKMTITREAFLALTSLPVLERRAASAPAEP